MHGTPPPRLSHLDVERVLRPHCQLCGRPIARDGPSAEAEASKHPGQGALQEYRHGSKGLTDTCF